MESTTGYVILQSTAGDSVLLCLARSKFGAAVLFPYSLSSLSLKAAAFSSLRVFSRKPVYAKPKSAAEITVEFFLLFSWRMSISANSHSNNSKCSFSGVAPLQAILFDIDGTLCDSDPLHYYAFREMLQEIGFNDGVPITEEFYVKHISGKHNDDVAHYLFPDDLQRGLKFTDDKEAMFRRLASEQLKPVNGLHKIRKWVEDHGVRRAAVTNAPRENAELMISILGLSDFFEFVVLGDDCERAKPFPDPYLKALQLINASPDHTFVFEDSVSGIKAGVAAGMRVVGLTTRNPEQSLMEAGATFLIEDFEDPKLWAQLEELERAAEGTKSTA